MSALLHLFKFPVLWVDGDEEDVKSRKFSGDDIEFIKAEAEVPFYDFNSIQDRWLPNTDSLNRARDGKFSCCFVNFGQSGSFLVPWSKDKFKREYDAFVDNNAAPTSSSSQTSPGLQIITSKREIQEIINKMPDDEESDKPDDEE